MAKRVKVPEPLQGARKLAESLGWTVTRRTGSGHLVWHNPDGRVVFTPFSPHGGNRSIQNTIRDLRKGGLPV